MEALLPHAEKIAALLKSRAQTIAVAESSAGGLISAALLAVPGASAYFVGGAVVYTRKSLREFLHVGDDALKGLEPGTEALALARARFARERVSTTWGVSENGVAGPTGSRYGNPPGYSCIAVSGPLDCSKTIRTGSDDRVANMYAFAAAALQLLSETLSQQS